MPEPDDPKIIMPGDLPAQTTKQASAAIKPHEMPECTGNPELPCGSPATDFMIKGYDDKHRCSSCNEVHVELVMQEAGESSPNSVPQFVTPKLDGAAKFAELDRRKRIERLIGKVEEGRVDPQSGQRIEGQTRGRRGLPQDVPNVQPIADGDYKDMKDAMQKDEHGTRDEGITDEERRARIRAKYGQRDGGSSMT